MPDAVCIVQSVLQFARCAHKITVSLVSMGAGSSSNDNRFKSQEVHQGQDILQRSENTKDCMLIHCQASFGSCSSAVRGGNVFCARSARFGCKQVVRATLNGRTPPSELQARNGTHGATAAPDNLASIDVEFAHFSSGRESVTAAAEVCLLAGDGTTLWHSFIRPGTTLQSAPCSRSTIPLRDS